MCREGQQAETVPNTIEGGLGGVGPARPVTRSSHALSLSVLSHPSREARTIVFDFQGSRITPPAPPSQGGERDRSLATSFHRAQQKHASRNRPSSRVKTNFAACQAGADRREAPGPKPVRLGRRLRLRRQPPGSWQLWNGGVQRGVSFLVMSSAVSSVLEWNLSRWKRPSFLAPILSPDCTGQISMRPL